MTTYGKWFTSKPTTTIFYRLPELSPLCLYFFNSLRKWLTPLSTISTKQKVDNKREFAHSFIAHSPIGPNIISSLAFNFLQILPGGEGVDSKGSAISMRFCAESPTSPNLCGISIYIYHPRKPNGSLKIRTSSTPWGSWLVQDVPRVNVSLRKCHIHGPPKFSIPPFSWRDSYKKSLHPPWLRWRSEECKKFQPTFFLHLRT